MDRNYVNSFEITGTIVYVYKNRNGIFIRLVTSPFGHVDYPLVSIFNNHKKKIIDEDLLEKGKRLTVKGYVSTSERRPYGILIVTEAQIEKSRLEVAFDDDSFVPDKNIIKIKGVMTFKARGYDNNKRARFSVQTLNPYEKSMYPWIVAFRNTAKRVLALPAETPLACLCSCHTRTVDRRTLQSFVAQSIEPIE